jgi:hypothetical protein
MTKAPRQFHIRVSRVRGEKARIHGPYDTYEEARAAAMPFAEEGLHVEAEVVGPPICDFCSLSEVAWAYPAVDFVIPGAQWGSRGHWAACEACHDLIEANDREGLVMRSVDRFMEIYPEENVPRSFIEHGIRVLHDGFFAAKLAVEAQRES